MTLDRDGMAWADAAGNTRLFPARPRQVCDITGAGDMVLAALGYMIAAGADYPTAIEIANTAGGLEVERLGVVPLTRQEIIAEWSRGVPGGRSRAEDRRHRGIRGPVAAAAPGRAADRHDQRLLRSFAPRPRRLAAGGAASRAIAWWSA